MSTIKTNNIQVGQSATAAQNFTLYQPSTPDGTVRLGLGNAGATTLDVASFSSAGMSAAGLAGDIAAARITTALNATGSAPIYAARAWVNFNGTGTVAIRASGNVSSITDNGVGTYTVNFTTAMPDANYSIVGMNSKDNDLNDANGGIKQNATSTRTTTAVQVISFWGVSGAATDVNMISVSIFR